MKPAARRLALLWLLGAAAGCAPVAGPAEKDWIDLFDGTATDRWQVIQGQVAFRDGRMILDGRQHDVTLVAKDLDFRDGEVEMTVLRRQPRRHTGALTVAVRLTPRLMWQSIYFVCEPDCVCACRASFLRPSPPIDVFVRFPVADEPETWRFVLTGPRLTCHRYGKPVLRYTDASPVSGSVGLTASRCLIEVLSLRCRPAGEGS